MTKKYRSPAKIARSILRLLDYKQSYLEDCWDTEIKIDQKSKNIIWKASETLNLTLKYGVNIVENRGFYNPSFATKTFSQKLLLFQNMWKPDHDSSTFFSCMHEHFKRNSSLCNHFCGSFSSPYCGQLAFFLSTNNWPSP